MAAGGVEDRQGHVKKHRELLKGEERAVKIDEDALNGKGQALKSGNETFNAEEEVLIKWHRETYEGLYEGRTV